MLSSRQQQGRRWEQFASRWLQKHGLQPLAQNYHCKAGEIDLIMRDAGCLVFVEVRYRRQYRYGGPLLSVTAAKQQRLVLAARHFLQRHPTLRMLPIRFDIVGISAAESGTQVEWRRRAWLPGDADSG